jgi:hypothetical protein
MEHGKAFNKEDRGRSGEMRKDKDKH